MKSDTFELTQSDGFPVHVDRWAPDDSPRAIVQISHGMAEHAGQKLLGLVHQIFIVKRIQLCPQQATPVLHQMLVAAVIVRQLREVIGVVVSRAE